MSPTVRFPVRLKARCLRSLAWIAACASALFVSAGSAAAQAPASPITLYVGEAHVLNEPGVRRMAVGNGRVIQATALDDRQVLVLPEAPGQSTLVLWGPTGPERTYVFTVLAADTARLLSEVEAMLGDAPRVGARAVGDKILIEGGEVSEELSLRIGEITRRYPQVVNLLPRIGLERMIAMDVKFIEIRRDLLEDVGIRWNGAMQGPSFQVLGDVQRSGALEPGGAGEGSGLEIRPRVWPFATSVSMLGSLTSRLNLLVQNGDAVVLAEPRLSCRSGGSARFIAGGELPIPVSGALGTAGVAFKEYGIKFDVSPVASDAGLIAAKIATEISSINFDVAVKDVPGLVKRRAETDVNLRENETLVIAGLLADEGTRNMDRVAGASELPVLGPLFRSRQFRDRQTELVVFITPRFVTGAPMPEEAAAIRMAPMREARRLLPTLPALPPAVEPVPVTGEVTAVEAAAATGHAELKPVSPTPDPTAPAGRRSEGSLRPQGDGAPANPATGVGRGAMRDEDRGTAARYRRGREALRMVE